MLNKEHDNLVKQQEEKANLDKDGEHEDGEGEAE